MESPLKYRLDGGLNKGDGDRVTLVKRRSRRVTMAVSVREPGLMKTGPDLVYMEVCVRRCPAPPM